MIPISLTMCWCLRFFMITGNRFSQLWAWITPTFSWLSSEPDYLLRSWISPSHQVNSPCTSSRPHWRSRHSVKRWRLLVFNQEENLFPQLGRWTHVALVNPFVDFAEKALSEDSAENDVAAADPVLFNWRTRFKLIKAQKGFPGYQCLKM